MLLTVNELISTLRSSVNVQQEESEVIDPLFLVMSDEDLLLYIKLSVSRAYPNVTDLADLPDGSEYPVVLLSKIELYTKLAVMKADKVDMGVDNNNYLKNDQRFQHYMKLVQSAKEQYDKWLDNEGQGEVNTYDVLLDSRHYSHRNYEKQVKPKVSVYIDSVTADSVEFHWKVSNTSHFARYAVYVGTKPIVDVFKDSNSCYGSYNGKINEDSKQILSTQDIRNVSKRLLNLLSDTTYYVAVISIERNQVWGYAETSFTTLPVIEEVEDFDVDSL